MISTSRIKYPCLDCKKREPLCHSTCQEYLDAKSKHEELNRKRNEVLTKERTRNYK